MKRYFFFFCLICLISGCGQSGHLYIPVTTDSSQLTSTTVQPIPPQPVSTSTVQPSPPQNVPG